MSNSIILECKEVNNLGDKKNPELGEGEMEIILQQPVRIDAGDTIGVKSGFLDTVNNSAGLITIREDEEDFEIQYLLGVQNYHANGKIYNDIYPENQASDMLIDNQAYFLSSSGAGAGTLVVWSYASFYHKMDNQVRKFWGRSATCEFSYTDQHGNKNVKKTLTLPKKIDADEPYWNVDAGNTIIQNGSLKQLTPTDKIGGSVNGVKEHITNHSPSATITTTPTVFTHSFSIPAGDYDPSELCILLSDKLSDINNRDNSIYSSIKASNNAFLWTNEEMAEQCGDDDAFFTASDGSAVFTMPTTVDYPSGSNNKVNGFDNGYYASYIGTDNIAFEYDEDMKKIIVVQTHSNIYDQGTETASSGSTPAYENQDGDIVIQARNKTLDNLDPLWTWAGRNGLIAFTSLTPETVWFDKMGLNHNIKVVMEQYPGVQNLSTNLPSVQTHRVQGGLIDGQHTTNAYAGADACINKNSQYYKARTKSNLSASSTVNTKIYAEKTLNQESEDQGYFLIEVRGGWDNKMINDTDVRANINAIVSRYYTTSSYTSFYQEGSIPYTHPEGSESQMLTSLRVRVLDANHNLSEVVKSDNTIFIEIIKGNNKDNGFSN